MLKKRKSPVKNLWHHAQKKQRLTEDSTEPSAGTSFEWGTGNPEEDHNLPANDMLERESILSELSQDEDVPTSDPLSLNRFLARAMSRMQEVVKRGKAAAAKGIRSTYAVKIGQKQSKRTINRHLQEEKHAIAAGQKNGVLERWLHPIT
jgi:hypothetical protein